MKVYMVVNLDTRRRWYVSARSPREACRIIGAKVGRCFVALERLDFTRPVRPDDWLLGKIL